MTNFKPINMHLAQRWISGRVGYTRVKAYFDRSGHIINNGEFTAEVAAEIESVYRENYQILLDHQGVDTFEEMARRFDEI